MSVLKGLLLSVFLSVSFANMSKAQESWEKFEEGYLKNSSLTRETFFLHLNNTAVVLRENLWISAYVYDTQIHMKKTKATEIYTHVATFFFKIKNPLD